MGDAMTIGQLAKAAGVNVETIRYYQRRGLVAEPRKPAGGYRRYSAEAIAQIAFVRRAQRLGFTLEEIGRLMRLAERRGWRETLQIARRKHAVIEARIVELDRIRHELAGLIAKAARRKGREKCPLIAALAAGE